MQATARRLAACAVAVSTLGGGTVLSQSRTAVARRELGEALFRETAFSNPGADFTVSCNSCHRHGPDPLGEGSRFFSDGSARSLMPGLGSVDQAVTLRNTPALVDLAGADRLGWAGRYESLEALLSAKLLARHLGWREEDRDRARAQHHYVLTEEMAVDYPALFRAAYRVELGASGEEEAFAWLVRALADHVREIASTLTSRWDAFADMNRIPVGPSRGEPPRHYGGRVLGRIANQEGRVLIKRPRGFGPDAYEGFKTFFRVEGRESVGNCVACHVPPAFTDFRFHGAGVSELEYEAVHGEGASRGLEIPGPEGQRPVARLLSIPAPGAPQAVDLAHWNWIDLESSPQRREGESDEALLARMRGAFRTPGLRNLPRTDPYMHDGGYATLEDAVSMIVAVSRRARAGELPWVDAEYTVMRLDEGDVAPLAAFLRTLDEVPEDEFRELLLSFDE